MNDTKHRSGDKTHNPDERASIWGQIGFFLSGFIFSNAPHRLKSANMRLESLHELLGQEELVPQAILRIPIERLAIQHSIKLEVGADDFDKYVGAAFRLDDTRFAIMHYAGHPDGTSTIYLPYSINDVVKISYFISKIASELGLSATDFEWQRKDDLTKSAS